MSKPRQDRAHLRLIAWASLAGFPVILLAGHALIGLEAARKAIQADAHQTGQGVTPLVGEALADTIDASLAISPVTRLYDHLPKPGPASPLAREWEKIREEDDLAALRKWRDETPSEALTPTGIPLRVLAAWQLVTKLDSADDRETLRQLALREAPSVLTPTLLRKTAITGWESLWQRDERVRELLATAPRSPDASPLVLSESGQLLGIAQIDVQENGWRALLRDELLKVIDHQITSSWAPWMGLQVLSGQDLLFDSTGRAFSVGQHEILASRRDLLEVRTYVADAETLMAPWRRQRTWTFTTVALVTLSAAVGLTLTITNWNRERRLHHLKSQFVASVSHELRAPVASMRLMAEALDSESVHEAEKKKEFYRLLAHEGARLSTMVENVLDVARIEEGRKTYHYTETDVQTLVQDAVSLLEPQAVSKEIRLLTQLSTIDPPPQLDGIAVQQALINLLDNAIKFSPRNSSIGVTLDNGSEPCGPWTLSVRDEGPGIAPQDRQRIFDRFTRLQDELRRETQGAGIGLSLVKHVVIGHGGRIEVENNKKAGCTFTLSFPRHPPDCDAHA